jgi:uncharacterized protein
MNRFIRASLLLVLLIIPLNAPASASQLPDALPEATAEMAPVGASGPRLVVGDRVYTTSEYLGLVVQDASVMWGTLFAAWERPFVPPTVVLVEAGAYARSGCGINAGDPRENERLVPVLYCRYGGATGAHGLDATGMAETGYVFSPVLYFSVPALEAWVETSGSEPEVALAYRVVREYAYHIQHLLGITDHTGGGCCDLSDEQVELVAECFAGVWAFSAYDQGQLDSARVEAVQGPAWDDHAATLRVFGREGAYGSADQRLEAFLSGYENGNPSACLAGE